MLPRDLGGGDPAIKRTAAERIADIQHAIARCLDYAPDLDSANERHASMTADAIERNIAIIGEAATHLPEQVTSALPDVDWAGIRGMRNSLVHQYYGIETAIIRDVLDTKLKPLSEQLTHHTANHPS